MFPCNWRRLGNLGRTPIEIALPPSFLRSEDLLDQALTVAASLQSFRLVSELGGPRLSYDCYLAAPGRRGALGINATRASRGRPALGNPHLFIPPTPHHFSRMSTYLNQIGSSPVQGYGIAALARTQPRMMRRIQLHNHTARYLP